MRSGPGVVAATAGRCQDRTSGGAVKALFNPGQTVVNRPTEVTNRVQDRPFHSRGSDPELLCQVPDRPFQSGHTAFKATHATFKATHATFKGFETGVMRSERGCGALPKLAKHPSEVIIWRLAHEGSVVLTCDKTGGPSTGSRTAWAVFLSDRTSLYGTVGGRVVD